MLSRYVPSLLSTLPRPLSFISLQSTKLRTRTLQPYVSTGQVRCSAQVKFSEWYLMLFSPTEKDGRGWSSLGLWNTDQKIWAEPISIAFEATDTAILTLLPPSLRGSVQSIQSTGISAAANSTPPKATSSALSTNHSTTYKSEGETLPTRTKVGLGVGVGLGVILVAVSLLLWLRHCRHKEAQAAANPIDAGNARSDLPELVQPPKGGVDCPEHHGGVKS